MSRSKKPEPPRWKPALKQIGRTHCPVCNRAVAVFLAKTQRPFINCSYCSARIFYNGLDSMRLLRKRMEPIEEEDWNERRW